MSAYARAVQTVTRLAASAAQAVQLLAVLPDDLREDFEVSGEEDGDTSIEWYNPRNRGVCSVSVRYDGRLHYAAHLKESLGHGAVDFDGTFPEEIAVLVRRVFA
jgi:hypothetical protein